MKLTSLHIERFGTRSNLLLEGLSDRLNVVYGPNGSGKTTIINFIQWMLYGSSDDASRPFLPSAESRLGGMLRIIDGQQQRRRIERYYDAGRGDHVRVTHDDATGTRAIDPPRLTGVDLTEYTHVFCFGFEHSPPLERLIDVTAARRFALAYDQTQMRQLHELTARLDSLRCDAGTWASDETHTILQERRRRLQDDIQQAERAYAERRWQWQQECDALAAEMTSHRRHLEALQAMLRRTEATLETRRRQLAEFAYQAQQTRGRWMEERRQEVTEIDYQIQQWHNVLESIRQRQESLHAQLSHRQPHTSLSSPADENDLRLFLRSLSYQIDDIEQDYREWEEVDESREDRDYGEHLRHVLGTTLHSMRDDVQRLCRELQRQQANSHYHDRAGTGTFTTLRE